MSLKIARTDGTKLATPYAGVGLDAVYLRVERVVFDFRQDTLDYDYSAYASPEAMATAGTVSVPIPELLGLPMIKVGLSKIEQEGGQLAIAYTHLKALLVAVVGTPYTVTDI